MLHSLDYLAMGSAALNIQVCPGRGGGSMAPFSMHENHIFELMRRQDGMASGSEWEVGVFGLYLRHSGCPTTCGNKETTRMPFLQVKKKLHNYTLGASVSWTFGAQSN